MALIKASVMTSLSPIALIYMGGTFGSIGQPLQPLAAAQFLPHLQQLLGDAYPALQSFIAAPYSCDSSQLQPQHWQALLTQFSQLQQQDLHKILLIHGTDTLAYAAALLAEFLAGYGLQVVVTGSQFPLLEQTGQGLNPHSDALHNLNLAYQSLTQSHADGVWVAFDGQVWPALSVQKIHSTATPTFATSLADSQTHGACDVDKDIDIDIDKNTYPDTVTHAPLSLNTAALNQLNIVMYYVLPLAAALQAQQLEQLIEAEPQAIIILAFGSGNLPQHPAMAAALERAWQAQILVVLASQVTFGGVNFNYAAAHWLQQSGVLSAAQLPIPALYARLAWLLCQDLSFAARQALWNARLINACLS